MLDHLDWFDNHGQPADEDDPRFVGPGIEINVPQEKLNNEPDYHGHCEVCDNPLSAREVKTDRCRECNSSISDISHRADHTIGELK